MLDSRFGMFRIQSLRFLGLGLQPQAFEFEVLHVAAEVPSLGSGILGLVKA